MLKHIDCRNPVIYNYINLSLEKFFLRFDNKLIKIKQLAQEIKSGIEKISPFIEKCTSKICHECKNVCCINKHGYYNLEDLVYLHALSISPPEHKFGLIDTDPCQFLRENGCILERSFRPSGCNWYFCEPLLEYMEGRQEYQEFDISLTNIAELWIEMNEKFTNLYFKDEKYKIFQISLIK